jgi:hypothetical protein
MSCDDHMNNRLSELGAGVAREWRCRRTNLYAAFIYAST